MRKNHDVNHLRKKDSINDQLTIVPPAENKHHIQIDFKPVAESIKDGFFTVDNSWNITYWNKEIEIISGFEKEKALGKGLWNFFNNQGNLKLYLECRRAKQQNISIRFEEFYQLLNTWIEVHAYPTESGLAVFVKNITAHKTAQEALRVSNERYDLVVKATDDLVWDWDIISGEIYRNSAGVNRVYGHASNESIKTNQLWSDQIHPLDKKNIDELIAYYISSENESSFSFEYRFRRQDGLYNYINDKGYIIRNELGIVVRMIGAARDITAQKQAEDLVLASEEQYRNLFNNNPCCIFIWDFDQLKIVEANQAAVDLYGYSKSEFRELTVLDIRPTEDHAAFLEMAEITRYNENYRQTRTWRHLTRKGEIIFMEISTQHLFYNGKKCLLAIGNNITDKVQLEKSLQDERQLLHKQITDAVISGQERERSKLGEELHDNINQILASSKLYIECAIADENIRKDLLEKTKSQLGVAMEEIRKLSKSLLPPSLGKVSLLSSLDELAEDMSSLDHIQIIKHWKGFDEMGLEEKLKLTIFRIVQEQLNNIHRHSCAESASISLRKENDSVFLSVEDNGAGFDVTSKKNGLGLRNISSRAEVNNGTVQIESAPGKGCKLYVVFRL